jgi:hypothetical protein
MHAQSTRVHNLFSVVSKSKTLGVIFLSTALVFAPGHLSVAKTPGYILFIGDSYCSPSAALPLKDIWPYRLSRELGLSPIVNCRGGTGYIATGSKLSCGISICGRFGSQLAIPSKINKKNVELLVISGGKNDLGFKNSFKKGFLYSGIDSTIKNAIKLYPKTRIVVVSPFWDATPVPPGLNWEIGLVREAAKQNNVHFIQGTEYLFQEDSYLIDLTGHPNVEGHKVIYEYVLKAIEP